MRDRHAPNAHVIEQRAARVERCWQGPQRLPSAILRKLDDPGHSAQHRRVARAATRFQSELSGLTSNSRFVDGSGTMRTQRGDLIARLPAPV